MQEIEKFDGEVLVDAPAPAIILDEDGELVGLGEVEETKEEA